MPFRIAIVDDKLNNRNILRDKLRRGGRFDVCLTAADGSDFMQQMRELDASAYPDVVLMDLEMPNMDGVDTIAVASCLYPNVRYVVLTIFDDEDKIFRAIKAGAFGYLLKDESAETISDMLQQMEESGTGPISPGIAHKILQMVQKNELSMPTKSPGPVQQDFFDLTQREKEILQLLVKGLAYRTIGIQLNISAHTAKKHVMNIYQKLHINSRAQALRLAYEKGML